MASVLISRPQPSSSPSDDGTPHASLPSQASQSSYQSQAIGSDLRHMTSNTALLTPNKLPLDPRRPTKLMTNGGPTSTGTMRKGSRSPTSIPSSPTSVHSSSSAIFERDIEHPQSLPALSNASILSSHTHPQHNHTSQMKSLESSVPSVLTSAVELLADAPSAEDSNISVISPTTGTIQSRMASRSPSPTRRSFIGVGLNSGTASPSSRAGNPERQSTMSTLSGTAPTTSPSSPHLSPSQYSPPLPSYGEPLPSSTSSYQASPNTVHKRLSFISYSDLLSSAPLSSVPLSSIVAPPTSEPPPHIPAVLGNASEYTTVVGEDVTEWQNRGEWEREGFGKGLEERLEEVLKEGEAPSVAIVSKS